jgi:hypothetical protein
MYSISFLLLLAIKWEALRHQTAPIIPQRKNDYDTDNFARIQDKLDEHEKANPFAFLPKDGTAVDAVLYSTEN